MLSREAAQAGDVREMVLLKFVIMLIPLLLATCTPKTDHTAEVQNYGLEIIEVGDSFTAYVSFSAFDTTSLSVTHGFVALPDSTNLLFTDNPEILSITGKEITPNKAGNTKAYLLDPRAPHTSIVDSFVVMVESLDGKLKVTTP